MRRLLILSYYFPPSNEVAGKPTARLLWHMPAQGWEPVVVAPRVEAYEALDPAGYADVQRTVRIERTGIWPSPRSSLLAMKRMARLVTGRGGAVNPQANGAAQTGAVGVTQVANTGHGTLRTKLREVFRFPDMYSGWIMPAYRRAAELLRDEPFDAMLSISPEVSAHLAALRLHRRFPHVPWFAQFHDPWSGNPYKQWKSKTFARWEQRLESAVVRNCDRLICATEGAAEALTLKHRPSQPVLTIHNGFDPLDFPTMSAADRTDPRLTFTYTGSLYWTRNPFPLLEALKRLIDAGKLYAEKVRVRLIGDCEMAVGRSVRTAVDELGLSQVVEIQPPVDYAEALGALVESDVLLLFAEDQPVQVPAKLFEYLHVGRPILAFATGETARIVDDCGAGQAVTSADATGIEAAILATATLAAATSGRQSNETCGNWPSKIDRFRADQLAEKLAVALNQTVDERAAQRAMKPVAVHTTA